MRYRCSGNVRILEEPLCRNVVDAGVLLGYLPGESCEPWETEIGPNCVLRSGTVVYAGCTIGRAFETGHGVVIREGCAIGDGVHIWSGTFIGKGSRIGDGVVFHMNITACDRLVVEDGVFVASNSVFANDPWPPSDDVSAPVLRRGARIGVGVSVCPGVEIGEFAMVGAGAVVVRDVPPYAVVVGNPARVIGDVRERDAAQREAREAYEDVLGEEGTAKTPRTQR